MRQDPPPALKVKRLRSGAQLPRRASEGASGLDVAACLDEPGYVDLGPDPILVPTGIALESPAGYDVQVRPRSGLSAQGVAVAFGTIDSDYRGELLVTMYTVGRRRRFRIQHGDRIAQLVVTPLAGLPVAEVEDLSPTARGAAGHGSTGL